MSAPDPTTANQLPDLRLWLAQQWTPGHPYYDAAAAVLMARGRPVADIDGGQWSLRHPPGRPPTEWEVTNAAKWEHTTIRNAALWWVGEDMVDLLIAAAAGVPDDTRVEDLPRPSPSGLIVFAKPWVGLDADRPDNRVTVDAMIWGAAKLPPDVRPGSEQGVASLSTSSYRRIRFEDGLSSGELNVAAATGAFDHARREEAGHWRRDEYGTLAVDIESDVLAPPGVSHLTPVPGRPPMRDGERAFTLHGTTWLPLGRSDWPIEDRIDARPYAEMSEAAHASYVEDRKILAALWTLVHQEGVTSRVVQDADRPARRRTERAGLPREAASVQVVTLRKPRHAPSEGEGSGPKREYSHRWLVAGHWRWQPCGPRHSQRRLTFVRPHVKGPEGKPLATPERVNAWVR